MFKKIHKSYNFYQDCNLHILNVTFETLCSNSVVMGWLWIDCDLYHSEIQLVLTDLPVVVYKPSRKDKIRVIFSKLGHC